MKVALEAGRVGPGDGSGSWHRSGDGFRTTGSAAPAPRAEEPFGSRPVVH
ncbi:MULTISPECIES: hypothetical protein [Streptomyces]|nr:MULTISPECIES: hypothetical protein [Streptomyces]